MNENTEVIEKDILESVQTTESDVRPSDLLSDSDGSEMISDSAMTGSLAVSGTLTEGDPVIADTLMSISNDVHLILVLFILTFAMSCMRAWRRNSIKGV